MNSVYMPTSFSSNTTFTPFVVVLITIAIIPAVFYETTLAMIDIWLVNETFTHGFIIFPISIWLIWKKRNLINALPHEAELRVLTIFLPILGLWFVAKLVDVLIIQQLAMIALIPITIWLISGRNILLTILFPVFFLIFAVPLGQSLIPPMMELTASFTVFLIQLTGIPVYQDGLFFTLPSGNWSVVEECSGVRYLIASICLGTIYAYINYQSFRKRLLFMLVSIAVPIIANGLRAFGIVIIGHLSGMELATGVDHLVYGWLFFGVVIFLMFYVGSFWWDPISSNISAKSDGTAPSSLTNHSIFLKSVAIATILIVGVRLSAYQLSEDNISNPGSVEISLPDSFQEWQHEEQMSTGWKPEITNTDATIRRSYRFELDIVQLDIGYYQFQRQGAEAVSGQNRLTDPINGAWKITHSGEIQYKNLYLEESIVRHGNRRVLVWRWYRIGSHVTANRYMAKIFDAFNQIFIGRNDATMITLATLLDESTDVGRKKLERFYQEAASEIYQSLEHSSDGE